MVAVARGPRSTRGAAAHRWSDRRRPRARGWHHRPSRDRGCGRPPGWHHRRAGAGAVSDARWQRCIPYLRLRLRSHELEAVDLPAHGRAGHCPQGGRLADLRAAQAGGPATRLPGRSRLRPGGHRHPGPGAPRWARGGRGLRRATSRHPDHRGRLRHTIIHLLLQLDGHRSRGHHRPRPRPDRARCRVRGPSRHGRRSGAHRPAGAARRGRGLDRGRARCARTGTRRHDPDPRHGRPARSPRRADRTIRAGPRSPSAASRAPAAPWSAPRASAPA